MKDRMSLIVFSGTVDKLMAASILATGGAAMDMEVIKALWRNRPAASWIEVPEDHSWGRLAKQDTDSKDK